MAATVGLGTVLTGIPAEKALANSTINELEEKSQKIQNESSEINSQIDDAKEKVEEIQGEQSQVESEINRIDLAINDTSTKISEKNQQISEKDGEVTQLKTDIDAAEKRIELRNELLKERARAYQEGGGVISYIDVLMGAQSFGDFIDRFEVVATILSADQKILKDQMADKKSLEEMKAKVETELKDLEVMRKELESLKSTLDAQKADKDNYMAVLEEQKVQAVKEQMSLEEEQKVLANQEAAIQKAIELEQQRQAEIKKQQEEAAKAAAAKQQGNGNQGAAPVIPAPSGNFIRPAAGSVTSGFGNRILNGQPDYHYGVDIAKPGSVPIYASAGGVVLSAGVKGTYGNAVMITHYINGQIYTTVYAHMSSISVSSNQTVSQGQVIGYMGSTGNSTGQHLHFELHRGEWNGSRTNAINPASMVPIYN